MKVHDRPTILTNTLTRLLLLSIQNSQQCGGSSASSLVVGIAGEAKLGDHQVGEAEWHEAIDLCQPVQTVGSLKEVFWTVPHTLIPTAGILFQVAKVHGFDKDPRRFLNAACGVFPQIQGDSKVRGNVVTILCFVHQRMHFLRLVLEELQVAAVEEGSTNQHHGVSAASGPGYKNTKSNKWPKRCSICGALKERHDLLVPSRCFWVLQFKAAITVDSSWC